MSQNGKGSKPRPLSVNRKSFDESWDRIFKKKDKPEESKEETNVERSSSSNKMS